MFAFKLDYGLSKFGYDSIIKCAKSMLLGGNREKENFLYCKIQDETS
jgi:hypothetical protein